MDRKKGGALYIQASPRVPMVLCGVQGLTSEVPKAFGSRVWQTRLCLDGM